MGAVYLLIGLVYLMPCVFLIRYAGGIKKMSTADLAGGMEAALKHQKSFWKFLGIFMLSVLVVYFLAIAALILFFVFRFMKVGGAALTS